MRAIIAVVVVLLVGLAPAQARHVDKHHHHGGGKNRHIHHHSGHGLVTISTAAGSVTVAPSFAPKIKGFIGDVVGRGFRGRVHCYASGGHVAGSLHYSGRACDFAQRGWGLTVRPMYRVADLARKWGLRDGCTFRDCGHIDSGDRLARHRGGSMLAHRGWEAQAWGASDVLWRTSYAKVF